MPSKSAATWRLSSTALPYAGDHHQGLSGNQPLEIPLTGLDLRTTDTRTQMRKYPLYDIDQCLRLLHANILISLRRGILTY